MPEEPERYVLLSDAERRQGVDALFGAHRDGRIDLEDLDRRLRAAYAARTVGELAVPLAGLPGPPPGTSRVEEVERIEGSGGLSRTGRWTVSRWTRVEQHPDGGAPVVLDLSESEVRYARIDIELLLGMTGRARIVVPPGAGVDVSGVTGRGRPARTDVPAEPDPGGLQVVVTGSTGRRNWIRVRHSGDARWWERF